MPIDCSKCNGNCCRHVVAILDRGDGTCKYFNEQNHLCNIYENRPLICNTDRMYEMFFKDVPRERYDELNREMCNYLCKEGGATQ